MILLSRIFKFYETPPNQQIEKKVITLKTIFDKTDKPTESDRSMNQQISQVLSTAELQAEQIISAAQREAEHIQQQVLAEKGAWESEKLLLTEQAQEAGFLKGLEEGRSQGYEEVHQSIIQAQQVIDAAKQDYFAKIEAAEGTILRLGMKVAEKIIGSEIESNQEAFLSVVKTVLKEVRDECEVQVHVHPSNYQFILAQKEELLMVFPTETMLYIYPNEELAETSCVIESNNGRIDASIDSQLAELKQKLFELLESES